MSKWKSIIDMEMESEDQSREDVSVSDMYSSSPTKGEKDILSSAVLPSPSKERIVEESNPFEEVYSTDVERTEISQQYRIVEINERELNKKQKYPSNFVKTSKYTILTFLPRNLFEQFRRVANFYFLGVVCLQTVPGLSPFPWWTAAVPLSIMISLSAFKELYEDIKRHQEDRLANSQQYRVYDELTHSFQTKTSLNIVVGDLVWLPNEAIIPADCIVLSTSKPDGSCYVSTASLDGEVVPKKRKAAAKGILESMETEVDCQKLRGTLYAHRVNKHLTGFEGTLTLFEEDYERDAQHGYEEETQVVVEVETDGGGNKSHRPAQSRCKKLEGRRVGLHDEHVILRGCKVANTQSIWGLVFATGKDTKLMLNLKETQTKFATFEKILNMCVIALFCFQLLICLIMTIGRQYAWEWDELRSSDPTGNFFLQFLTNLILFSFFIPLSLYVTIEFVKVGQARLMEQDKTFEIKIAKQAHNEQGKDSDAIALCPLKGTDRFHAKGLKVNNSSLSDELGLVDFIFTDKTGTLTINHMELSQCSIDGVLVENCILKDESELSNLSSNLTLHRIVQLVFRNSPAQVPLGNQSLTAERTAPTTSPSPRLNRSKSVEHSCSTGLHQSFHVEIGTEFLFNLAINHGVNVERTNQNEMEYTGESPDELAFVTALDANGFHLLHRENDILRLEYFARPKETFCALTQDDYDRLHQRRTSRITWTQAQTCNVKTVQFNFRVLAVLKFTSKRRRMTSVVENLTDNTIHVYSKGADSVILPRCRVRSEAEKRRLFATELHLQWYAERGSRTLVFASKVLDRSRFEKWHRKYKRASISLEAREESIEKTFNLIEENLELLGCTAVDDQMQYGVPDTVEALLKAGIKLCMVTGDKQETAVTIGRASHLIPTNATLLYVNVTTQREAKLRLLHILEKYITTTSVVAPSDFVLIIDGFSLELCITVQRKEFQLLVEKCHTIICNRATPAQKAMVVRLAKHDMNKITLAIGDGANDTSMIIESNVGIGIRGEEGSQAALASDFVLTRFRHLQNLLFIHGRFCFLRTGNVVLLSFYKNTCFILPIFYYAFFSGFTATPLYFSAIISMYNMFFTSLPPIAIGLTEKDVAKSLLVQYPQAFRNFREKRTFTVCKFLRWLLTSIFHSSVIYFLVTISLLECDVFNPDGLPVDLVQFGTLVALCVIFLVNITYLQYSHNWNRYILAASALGPSLFLVIVCLLSEVFTSTALTPISGVFARLNSTLMTPLYVFLAVGICVLSSIAYHIYTRYIQANIVHQLQEVAESWPHEQSLIPIHTPSQSRRDVPSDQEQRDHSHLELEMSLTNSFVQEEQEDDIRD